MVFSVANVKAQQKYWQQKVDYYIQVSLNDKERSLDAFEKINYTNNSPDTLQFIWFHLWPNAYKNDKTAFSNQLLENGRTDFYFSNNDQRGYINRLDFRTKDVVLRTEPHPKHIDIIKVVLNKPLAPGKSIEITTPFHVKLPFNFSRGGYIGNAFQVTQWYPKPAVYDSKGWHEMPYLDQGEFYSEFGNFNVEITAPETYIIAASGKLTDDKAYDKLVLLGKSDPYLQQPYLDYKKSLEKKVVKKPVKKTLPKSKNTKAKTLTNEVKPVDTAVLVKTKTHFYSLENAVDFAWFAAKDYIVRYAELDRYGKKLGVFSYAHPFQIEGTKYDALYAGEAVDFYSDELGDYPYNTVSVVSSPSIENFSGGMEYPAITLISMPTTTAESRRDVIVHEVGHNWFQAVIASNEREYPWMDEGMNSYYEQKFMSRTKPDTIGGFLGKRIPDDEMKLLLDAITSVKKDQPINTHSAKLTEANYGMIAYAKASEWMKELAKYENADAFEQAMKDYYAKWKFRHPYPEDFKSVVDENFKRYSAKNTNTVFAKLDTTGYLTIQPVNKKTKLTFLFNLKNTDSINYISIAPAIGTNKYDGAMIGGLIHNYQLPFKKFNFLVAPLYATRSKKFNVMGRLSYNIYTPKDWIEVSGSIAKYSMDDFENSDGSKVIQQVQRIVPSVKWTKYDNDLRSLGKWIFNARTFLLQEDALNFNGMNATAQSFNTYINQLSITRRDDRVLYPYNLNLTVEQGKQFVRAGFTGKYFFNYDAKGNGVEARLFAGKFFYTKPKTFITEFETGRYHFQLTGPKGDEDYTYSNYFMGRNEFEGFYSQQIMQRDGFFKIRVDQFSNKVTSDDWLSALNLSSTIPDKINPLSALPFKIPLKVFLDVGTYSAAWKDEPATGKFLYDAGLQLTLFKVVNIYAPIVYSKVYRDFLKTLPDNNFWRNISFSIDIQDITLRKITRNSPL